MLFTMALATLGNTAACAGGYGFAIPGGYGLKIYRVESGLYPFIQAYFRTFDQNKQPLVNLNERNIGLMVKGRAYDPAKRQYGVESIRQRKEATRSVLVLDASKSMVGPPFDAARQAAINFIDSKRLQDEVAILAIRDNKEDFQIVSEFEREAGTLERRLADVRVDGLKTRLYDSIGAAMQMCAMTAQGSISPTLENYIVSCSIVVFSDGHDEGSAISREELNARITALPIPIPVYSVAYSKLHPDYFKNLEALSKNSFGVYYSVGEAFDRMQGVVDNIQHIVQSDYVITFRSYVPVDGEQHAFKLGVEYPSGSGKYTYESGHFEAIEAPPVPGLQRLSAYLSQRLTALQDNNPYFSAAPGSQAPAGSPFAAPSANEEPASLSPATE